MKRHVHHRFTGIHTALVTPFRNGDIDEAAFKRLIKMQAESGVDGIVPVGTTGESATLNYGEHLRVIQLAVLMARHVSDGKLKVIAGTGGNSTKEAIYLTQEAEKLDVDASLQVAPYYNKPTQEGVYQHFRAVAQATELPIILYSIPGRCGIDIAVETVVRLAKECPNVMAIKEAGGNADRVSQLRAALGPEFTILSGDDALTLPFMAVGAQGVISVASNVMPRKVAEMVHAYWMGSHGHNDSGYTAISQKLHRWLYPLFKALFLETNPVPVKTALAMMGLIEEEFRLPLVPMHGDNRVLLRRVLEEYHLVKPLKLSASRKKRGDAQGGKHAHATALD